MNEDLPDEYIPAALRNVKPRVKVTYAGAYRHEGIPLSWTFGPDEDVRKVLNWIPHDPVSKPTVYRLELDGTNTPLYRWIGGKWRKEVQAG